MIIGSKQISGKDLIWTLRCPTQEDASELSILRVQIDSETEYLDREVGEDYLSPEDFRNIITEDRNADRHLFLIAETDGIIVGFTRCIGYDLKRFQHKADFGICILKDYWGYGIGKILIEAVINWAASANIKKIALTVVENNISAIQLYKKYGFEEEGLLIKDRIHKDGRYYDTVIMGKHLDYYYNMPVSI